MVSPLAGSLARTINSAFKGLFFDATLTRDGSNSGEGYDPTLATPTVYTCKAIAAEYGKGVQGTDLVGATDMNILILAKSFKNSSGASVSIEPEPLDRIAISAQGISGVVYGGSTGMKAVKSDPARATYECRVVV